MVNDKGEPALVLEAAIPGQGVLGVDELQKSEGEDEVVVGSARNGSGSIQEATEGVLAKTLKSDSGSVSKATGGATSS